jgi:4-amino-4-deoxy-L-arabinose transferase-like glycosyltransferase
VHYWLLALVHPLFSDPVVGGRWLSVICGAVTVLMMFPLGAELARLRTVTAGKPGGMGVGTLLALFLIVNPLVAFYQRMALAESLLLLESTVLAWYALRFARLVDERGLGRRALGLGALWGAMLLTKQNFSYVLWALPVAATALRWGGWKIARRFSAAYAAATAVGLAMFLPVVLFASDTLPLSVRLFYKTSFVSSAELPRWKIFLGNVFALVSPRAGGAAQWWPHDASRLLDEGTLYVYLTPGVFLLAIAAPLLLRKRWRELVFVGVWAGLLLGTLAANANMVRTRYAFLGIVPVLLLAALAGEEVVRWRKWGAALVGALLVWPLAMTAVSNVDDGAPTMLAMDRAEYLGSSCAGIGAAQAVNWLEAEARKAPITVVTGTGFGIEQDLMWLRLRGNANVQLLATDDAVDGGTQNFCVEQWCRSRRKRMAIAAGRAVYRVVPVSGDGRCALSPAPAVETYGRHAPLVTLFANDGLMCGARAVAGVGIVRLDAPSVGLQSTAKR